LLLLLASCSVPLSAMSGCYSFLIDHYSRKSWQIQIIVQHAAASASRISLWNYERLSSSSTPQTRERPSGVLVVPSRRATKFVDTTHNHTLRFYESWPDTRTCTANLSQAIKAVFPLHMSRIGNMSYRLDALIISALKPRDIPSQSLTFGGVPDWILFLLIP
jgi:hypothetical protein